MLQSLYHTKVQREHFKKEFEKFQYFGLDGLISNVIIVSAPVQIIGFLHLV